MAVVQATFDGVVQQVLCCPRALPTSLLICSHMPTDLPRRPKARAWSGTSYRSTLTGFQAPPRHPQALLAAPTLAAARAAPAASWQVPADLPPQPPLAPLTSLLMAAARAAPAAGVQMVQPTAADPTVQVSLAPLMLLHIAAAPAAHAPGGHLNTPVDPAAQLLPASLARLLDPAQ